MFFPSMGNWGHLQPGAYNEVTTQPRIMRKKTVKHSTPLINSSIKSTDQFGRGNKK